MLIVGVVTLIAGGLRALRQHDLKLLLAVDTVSQLGLMVVLFGAGTPSSTAAGWMLLVAHAVFKAAEHRRTVPSCPPSSLLPSWAP